MIPIFIMGMRKVAALRGGAGLVSLLLCLVGGRGQAQAAGFAVNINFQKTNSVNVSGYLPDAGFVFGDRGNGYAYGWDTDNTANAFERTTYPADQRIETGNKLQAAGQSRSWSIEVPNGLYDVRLVAADPADKGGLGTRYNIDVESARVIVDGIPSSSAWVFGTNRHVQVQVGDRRLTVSNGANATNNSICYIEIKQLAPIIWGASIIDNAGNKSPDDYTSETSPGVLGYFEGHAGKKISVLGWGDGWAGSSGAYRNFGTYFPGRMDKMRARGTIPFYTWAPTGAAGDTNYSLENITAGKHDTYLSNWASSAKAYGKPFFLRLAAEMNSTWEPWSEGYGVNSNSPPGAYTNMWRHVHDIFKQVGATNVVWVWCSDRDITNSVHLVPLSRFYPGDDYVDWMGIDSYGWGGESFTTVMAATYASHTKLAPGKPIMICETATVTKGGPPPIDSKPAWIADALAQLPLDFPNIRAFVWFNWNSGTTNKNWPIEGGDNTLPYTTAPVDWASVAAFSNGIASPYYLPNNFTNPASAPGMALPPIVLLDPPASVTSGVSNAAVRLSWAAVAGATNYNIYRSTSGSNGTFVWLARTTVTSYADAAVVSGTTYYYVVTAQNLAGESVDSAETTLVVSFGPPAPSGVEAAAISTSDIALRWNDNSTNQAAFKIEWSADNVNFSLLTDLAAGVTNFTDTGMPSGTKRYYRIRASGANGDSLPSNVASATTFFANGPTVVAKRVTSPITIDGGLSEAAWELTAALGKTYRGTPNNTGRFGVLWDTNYLYVGVQVIDGALWNDSVTTSDDDCVDICLDGDHNGHNGGSNTNYSPIYDRFFEKGWNDAALKEASQVGGSYTNGVLHAWALIAGGYNIELAIPWTNFGRTAAADMTIGFEVANNDDDDGGARDSKSGWCGSNNHWFDTSVMGDLYVSSLAAPLISTAPVSVAVLAVNGLLNLSWPSTHLGWQLLSQTNRPGLGLGTNWTLVAGSAATNRVVLSISPISGSVFYRLAYPAP